MNARCWFMLLCIFSCSTAMANVLAPAGPMADAIADLSWVLFIGAALLIAALAVLLVLAVRRGPAPISARAWIWCGGIVFPIAMLAALLAYSQWRSQPLRAPPPPDALIVRIVGHMWWWEVRYPAPGRPDVVLANEVRVPTGRTVRFALQSADVLHSVWFPSIAGKMDTVPGRVNHLQLRVDAPGVHRGRCAEFCGAQHARMGLHLVALAPQEFDAWLAGQAAPAAEPSTSQQLRGRNAFVAHRCGTCHTVRGVTASEALGPDLTHMGSRLALGAGTRNNSPEELSEWIALTQSIKAGVRMPQHPELDATTLGDVTAYLSHLK